MEVINQIPGFENGIVHYVSAADEVSALFLSAQMVSDLLNKWNTNVAFFSLTGRSEGLLQLVTNESKVARLYTVNQKNPNIPLIARKAQGMAHRKSVHKVIIEGLPEPDAAGKRQLELLAKSNISVAVITVNS